MARTKLTSQPTRRIPRNLSMTLEHWEKLREMAARDNRLLGAQVEHMIDEAMADGDDAAAS